MGRRNINKQTTDLRSKRRFETHFEHQNRLAEMTDFEREYGEPIVPAEWQQHGDFDDTFITHVETNTMAKTKRRRSANGLARLHENGHIDADQLAAAVEIAEVAEMIQRMVSVRGASLEARVDNSGSAKPMLEEYLARIRAERTYALWRQRLPRPKRMILDMLLVDRDLFATARVYRMGWPRARRLLIDALDRWNNLRDKIGDEIGEREAEAAYARLGEGRLK